ncbi:hypothetical protein AVEN_58356-1 [Araneus ventricosus]|uniref:Uncharacterized protein n=1 Tax=Araneus ventricosus TaxID=182803 RepID=A0A4Y2MJS2_ARAVE|nr:hypothetical protein AVEN_58356-1 [Araneus ventricosus]
MSSRIEKEHDFLNRVTFSDEATFHVSNKMNKHNCSENPHTVQGVERNSPKINVWCALSRDTVMGPFLFVETSVTANIYLNMLKIYAIPQMQHLQPNVIFQPLLTGARIFEHFSIQLSLTDVGYSGLIA